MDNFTNRYMPILLLLLLIILIILWLRHNPELLSHNVRVIIGGYAMITDEGEKKSMLYGINKYIPQITNDIELKNRFNNLKKLLENYKPKNVYKTPSKLLKLKDEYRDLVKIFKDKYAKNSQNTQLPTGPSINYEKLSNRAQDYINGVEIFKKMTDNHNELNQIKERLINIRRAIKDGIKNPKFINEIREIGEKLDKY